MRLLLLFFTLFTLSFASYDDGKRLYIEKNCGNCHGARLEGMHMYPALANRAKGFLAYKLKRFRSKVSDNQQQEMMIPFAQNLSDKDIDDLTIYMHEFVEDVNKERYDTSFAVEGDGGS
ncbi:MAG: cytochrome c [Sulfurimonas sp.]|nr:cytochrome c [Sulfurimonas sp.]MDD3836046.1 cytochrome c [Sulfurimonas sp.]